MTAKKLLVRVGLTIIVVGVLALLFVVYNAQRADLGWNPAVTKPTFTGPHPRVLIDEAHNNASTVGLSGRYFPFARLLRADGYDVQRGAEPFSSHSLAGVRVLVIANAAGAPKPQFFGINIPVQTNKRRGDPAFTADEIQTVTTWVREGGSLLFIADHAPFGEAAKDLAAAFGVKMYKGFLEVPNEVSDPLLFSRDNGRLGDHPIVSGDAPETRVNRVVTFTGQSLDGPAEATILLRLPDGAVEYFPPETGEAKPQPAGKAQGLAFTWGRGRVVVLGEAAMLTAQVAEGKPFGMNLPGNDNQRFALNIMHWLSGDLGPR
jgi:hypothetical protein